MSKKSVKQVLEEETSNLMSIPGVLGTAEGFYNNKTCIKVYVVNKSLELEKKIPEILDGYKILINEVGEIKKRNV